MENTKTGEIFQDDADVLLSARGNLNDYKWPDIPGFDTFGGEVTHSASWNQKLVRSAYYETPLTLSGSILPIRELAL